MERRLTLLGRSGLLISSVVLANVACWAIAGFTFSATDSLTNLALLAWVSPPDCRVSQSSYSCVIVVGRVEIELIL